MSAISYMSINPGKHRVFAVLYIATRNEELRNKYIELANTHNAKLSQNDYPDSGVDLYVPEDITFDTHYDTKFIDMQITSKMVYQSHDTNVPIPTGFFIHPRSSLSKTQLMLANHTGIIDYKGCLSSTIGEVDTMNKDAQLLSKQRDTTKTQMSDEDKEKMRKKIEEQVKLAKEKQKETSETS